MNYSEFINRKVLGVKVLYILLAIAAVLAYVAYRIPKAEEPPAENTGVEGEGTGTVATGDVAGSVYDNLKTSGTVVVAPVPPDSEDTVKTEYTNDQWVKDGAAWLVKEQKATGTEAITALTKYVSGQDRSYNENELINLWVREKGAPPDLNGSDGQVGAKPTDPIKAQGDINKGPVMHVVKAKGVDDMYGPIMTLYWGVGGQEAIDFLQAANTALPPNGPFPVGTRINVPQYKKPVYWTLPKNMKNTEVAAANGISLAQFDALNNRPTTIQWYKGAQVRVK